MSVSVAVWLSHHVRPSSEIDPRASNALACLRLSPSPSPADLGKGVESNFRASSIHRSIHRDAMRKRFARSIIQVPYCTVLVLAL